MPTLNKIRLAHILYNENHNLIRDLTLDLNQETTLLNLENGGGKTVMNQLCHAPYLNARERSFGKRKFAELFNNPNPSFVVHEWRMDEGGGLFLVGLMLTRRTRSSETSDPEDRLSILAFVDEFDDHQQPSVISSLELEVDGRPHTFQSGRKYLESLQEDRSRRLRLYNLDNSLQRDQYHKRLEELGISLSQWRQMRDFNLEESGIAKFAEKHPTEGRLLNDVFIPAAESKINAILASNTKGESVMRLIAGNIEKYAVNLFEHQEDLAAYETYQSFLTQLDQAGTAGENVRQAWNQQMDQENELRALQLGILEQVHFDEMEKQDTLRLLSETEKEKLELTAQQISHQYYMVLDQQAETEAAKAQNSLLLETAKTELAALNRDIQILVCARMQNQLQQIINDLESRKTRRAAAALSSAQAYAQMQNFGAALYELVQEEYSQACQNMAQLEKQIQASKAEKEKLNQEKKKLKKSWKDSFSQISQLEQKLNIYQTRKQECEAKLQITIPEMMEPYTNSPQIQALADKKTKEAEKAGAEIARNEKKLKKNREQIQENSQGQQELMKEMGQVQSEQKQAQNQLEVNEQIAARRRQIAQLAGDEELIWQDEKLKNALALLKAEENRQAEQRQRELYRQEQYLASLQAGSSTLIDPEVEKIAHDQGTELVFASAWLRQGGISQDLAQQYISRFPLLPYSLLLTRPQKESLLQALQDQNITTSQILPILDREQLDAILHEDLDGSLLEDFFYACYDTSLLHQTIVEQRIEDVRQEIAHLKEIIAQFKQEAEKDQRLIDWLENSSLNLTQYEAAIAHARDLKQRLQEITEESAQLKAHQQQLELEQNQLGTAIEALSKKEKAAQEAAALLATLAQKCLEAHDNQRALTAAKKKQNQLEEEQDENEVRLEETENQIIQLTADKADLNHEISLIQQEVTRFSPYAEIESEEEGDKDWLLSQFAAYESDPSHASLKELDQEISSLAAKQSQQKKELESELMDNELSITDLEDVVYSSDKLRQLRQKAQSAKEKCQKLSDQIQQQAIQLATLQERLVNQLQSLEEKTGQTEPVEREKIVILDWKAEIHQRKLLIQECQHDQQCLEKHMVELNHMESRIADKLAGISFENRILHPKNLLDVSTTVIGSQIRQSMAQLDQENKNRRNQIQKGIALMAEIQKSIPVSFDSLRDITQTLSRNMADPALFSGILEQARVMIQQNLERIQSSRDKILRMKEEIVLHIYDHILQLHEQILRIDTNISIEQEDSRKRMLEISLPKLSEGEEGHKLRIGSFVEETASRYIQSQLKETEIWDQVTPQNLFALVIPASEVSIRVRKIEEYRSALIPWNRVGKLSGAESFLSSMIIMLAVLYYQRSDALMNITGKVRPTAIFMDNPFAYVQSEHILAPLLSLLERTKMQMIALSKVENASIIRSFPNIYFLHLKLFADQKQHLIAEHKKFTGIDSIRLQSTLVDEK